MDEQNVSATEATETAEPSAAPETDAASEWDDEPIFPDEAAGDETETDIFSDGGETPAPESEGADAGKNAPSDDNGGGQTDAKADADKPPEPDYKALYEAQREKANADRYRAVYNEQLALSGNEAVARMIARSECGGKDYPLEDAAETPSASGKPDDFRAALQEIQTLYPDAKEMPEQVMRDFMGGKPLKDAYAAHRAKSDAETIAALRRENAALKKAESNRRAAPVKGVAGGRPENNDPFLEGFNDEW
ncbi:MAG: hypothetical protein IKN96_00550 [Oscillibacter sp.]|nr:hypothetical protein [Oscillibacter sp.]